MKNMGEINKLKQGSLNEHQAWCKYTPEKWDHCNEMVARINLEMHYKECDRFPIKWDQCEFEIWKSEFEKHSCVRLLSNTVKTQQDRITQLETEVSDLLKWYHSMQEYLSVLDSRIVNQQESMNTNEFGFRKSKHRRKRNKKRNFSSSLSKSLNNTHEFMINDKIHTPK